MQKPLNILLAPLRSRKYSLQSVVCRTVIQNYVKAGGSSSNTSAFHLHSSGQTNDKQWQNEFRATKTTTTDLLNRTSPTSKTSVVYRGTTTDHGHQTVLVLQPQLIIICVTSRSSKSWTDATNASFSILFWIYYFQIFRNTACIW